jgi:signal transduction histidine kinase
MSASKYVGPEPSRALESHGTPRTPASEPASAVLVQEKVLGEISHELGNFFHKLYYWVEYLRDTSRASQEETPTEMLERTIRNLEGFLKVSLGYFNPVQLNPMRMDASLVIDGLLFQVRAHLSATPFDVAREPDWAEGSVLVDPGQISQAFEIAVRHLVEQVGPDSHIDITFERSTRRDCPGLEVQFQLHRSNESSPLFRGAEAGVEWAMAQRILALHGGELSEQNHQPGERSMLIFLPLQPAES